jgi:peptidoglycan/LPS O-acetylase OafA/YrhL
MLALYLLIPQIRESAQLPSLWRYLFFTQNFGVPRIFGVTWSLCIEEHFYLFFPILVIILAKLSKPKMVGVLILLLIVGGVILRSLIWMSAAPGLNFNNPPEVWGFYGGRVSDPTYNRLDGLTLGVGLAALRCFRPPYWARLMVNGNSLLLLGLGGLFVSALVLLRQLSLISCALGFPLLAISFALITASAVSRDSWLCKPKLPGVHFIAVLSYSLYLTHPIALSCAARVSRQLNSASHLVLFPLAIIFCLSFSAALFCLVERPFLHIRDQLFSTKKNKETVVTLVPHGENSRVTV